MNSLAAGSLAGTMATLPMTILMKAIHRGLPAPQRRDPIPPEQITMKAADATSMKLRLGRSGRRNAVMATHFSYGAAAGATYAGLQHRLPGTPATRGVLFGLGVWAISYLGWLPAVGILPSATRWPAGRNIMMIASHVVWGAFTGLLTDRLTGRTTPRSRPSTRRITQSRRESLR